jgi:hypothetical protein
MEDEIFELIGRLITTLQDVAIDGRYTQRPMASCDISHAATSRCHGSLF